jgi:hypothetical protein
LSPYNPKDFEIKIHSLLLPISTGIVVHFWLGLIESGLQSDAQEVASILWLVRERCEKLQIKIEVDIDEWVGLRAVEIQTNEEVVDSRRSVAALGAIGGVCYNEADMGNCYLKKINCQLHYQLLLY